MRDFASGTAFAPVNAPRATHHAAITIRHPSAFFLSVAPVKLLFSSPTSWANRAVAPSSNWSATPQGHGLDMVIANGENAAGGSRHHA